MNKAPKLPTIIPNNNKRNRWHSSLCSPIKRLLLKVFKEPVPEASLALHTRQILDALIFAKTAQAIDNEKFTQPEFLLLIKIKYCLAKGIGEYAGLEQSIKYLQAAIEAKNSYLILDQTELRYRSSKQQEFYKYVEALLEQYENGQDFQKNVHAQLVETLPSIKTEEGKIALQAYEKELNKLAEYEFGLKLLSLFKRYELADYSILKSISDMALTLREKDTVDFKPLALMVVSKFDIFEKLGEIIGLSSAQNNPDTYAKMLQYVALDLRHTKSYDQFKELLSVMRKWLKPYQTILKIRQEYPPDQYKQPRQFGEKIPGEAIYEKYNRSLTDQRTGHTYFEIEG